MTLADQEAEMNSQNIIGLFSKLRVFSNYSMSPLLILISNHYQCKCESFCGEEGM